MTKKKQQRSKKEIFISKSSTDLSSHFNFDNKDDELLGEMIRKIFIVWNEVIIIFEFIQ